jgi:hypothetical protein
MQAQAASSAPETSVKLFSSPPKKEIVPVADASATKPAASLESKEPPKLSKTPDTKKVPEHANAFTHMMKRSSQVFSQSEPQKLSQRLHLCADGRVTHTCYSSNPGLSQPENIQWSATVNVKDRTQTVDSSAEKESLRTVELIVSSSIASAPATVRRRLVQKHSRLSVPVLKSIFQKSMRRRKPLPCVRVAMEPMESCVSCSKLGLAHGKISRRTRTKLHRSQQQCFRLAPFTKLEVTALLVASQTRLCGLRFCELTMVEWLATYECSDTSLKYGTSDSQLVLSPRISNYN